MSTATDSAGARRQLTAEIDYFSLATVADRGLGDVSRLPVTVKILLENSLRNASKSYSDPSDIAALAGWDGSVPTPDKERGFMPARVLLQDFTGVPAVVDLAAMRSEVARRGGDVSRIDPLVPVDLVVDHSVQVDSFGSSQAYERNIEREYERNRERYTLLRWAQQAFAGFRVVPPGMGIVHQVNLEYLSRVVEVRDGVAFPDTLIGTDSHTTMVNGIGVLGWGVGGIEAEAVMLGQPLFLLTPVVVGVRFSNSMPAGTTATDLVLTLTQMLRAHGVVNKFVEFCGDGLTSMTAADRATLSNMSPEFGATASLFPVDAQTLRYLRDSGRSDEAVDLVERYCKEQEMFRTDGAASPVFSELLELDLSTIEPSVAGPRRPQDRVGLSDVWQSFLNVHARGPDVKKETARLLNEGGAQPPQIPTESHDDPTVSRLEDGSVVIAAITSCTNTSNPAVMLGAGLLARNAVARGLQVPDYVKTSLAPGSRVVTDYLQRADLMKPLESLGFNLVGYGCTTCIGNSGPLPEVVAQRIEADDLAVTAVLSGNRNFEGRIHPQVKAAYLASPPLVVAFALAGTVHRDLSSEPLGTGTDGKPVYLREIWPSTEEIGAAMKVALGRELYTEEYGRIFDGDSHWQQLPSPTGAMFAWDADSTYVQEPPFFAVQAGGVTDIVGARVLALMGDSITTDHISPAGSISPSSPAADYLREHGVELRDFNTYGARRGNHEVMMRGTFANIRLRNLLAEGTEGGYTKHFDSGEITSIYEAAQRYRATATPLIVIAGKEYGNGSSRDWAAKGPLLLGVRAVIAESFERIHRSNLVGMGILPLEFAPGTNAASLKLRGDEIYSITGVGALTAHQVVRVTARSNDGAEVQFATKCRLDSATDVEYFRAGGILPLVLSELAEES